MSNVKVFQESIASEQSALVTLYILDATDLGVDIRYFAPQTDEDQSPILWQGVSYEPWPVEAKGYDLRSQGTLPRPTISFGNVFGDFTALCLNNSDLVGARVVRKRTFAKFLDGRPDADPTAQFPEDVYYIERKTEENHLAVTFELVSPMDVDDVALPKRKIIAGVCQWGYRSAECSFALNTVAADSKDNPIPLSPRTYRGLHSVATTYYYGDIVYTITPKGQKRFYWCKNDNSGAGISGSSNGPLNTTRWTADECSKKITGCKLRFTDSLSGLPYGGFPAVTRLPF